MAQKSKQTIKRVLQKRSSVPHAVVGIGASAGGLEAMTELLENLPQKTGMAYVYVQHLDPTHKSFLTPILARIAQIHVVEAKQGTRVQADCLYVIPPNKNMYIEKGTLRLVARVGGEGRLTSIDNFLRSLAADQKNRSIGVILSGNASDGSLGLQAIKGEGGLTYAQTEKTARHPSMPHSAIESGAADHVLAPADIARELARISRHPFVTQIDTPARDTVNSFSEKEKEPVQKIFAMLRAKSGINFSHYKSATLKRRIARRMVLSKTETLPEYVTYLQTNRTEIDALIQDMLINVTEFFRDREVFDHLKRNVFPLLLKEHAKDEPLRIWSAGCSTGEEAYTLAICFTEFLDGAKRHIPFQIFGSDLSEKNVAKARAGIYPTSIATDVSPERLRRFFTKVDGHYQISKNIRDICVFAKQDLIHDPPFSQLDLVSCRNVLIYLEQDAQKRIMQTFYYALRPHGFMVLGKSEGVGELSDMFLIKHKAQKIFSKKISARKSHFRPFSSEDSRATAHDPSEHTKNKSLGSATSRATGAEAEMSKDVDRILLSSGLVPPSVVIDESMQIVQLRGHLTPYLDFPTGKATWNLMKMAREDLMLELRSAISEAKKSGLSVSRSDIMLAHDDTDRTVNIEVFPLKTHGENDRYLLVMFRPSETRLEASADAHTASQTHTKRGVAKINKLERELATAKEHLRNAMAEEEAAREEFQSVNEEVVSSNEELQSTNEELETAKEELQSTNEELVTVNEELQTRNTELSQSNNDLTNVLTSSNVPIIIVDRELRIRRLTPMAGKSLRIIDADMGRSIADIKLPIRFPDLRELLLDVIETVQPRHQDVEDEEGRWYTLWVRPYKTWDNKIDGAIITLIDIDDIKQGQKKLEHSLSYAQGILSTMREPLLVLDTHLRVKSANGAFYKTFHTTAKATEGVRIYDLSDGQWNSTQLREALEKSLSENSSFQDLEIAFDFTTIGRSVMYVNGRRLLQHDSKEELILLAMEDITDHKILQERNDTFVSMASHELKTPVTTVKTLVQILQKRFESSPDKMLIEYLARMSTQIEQLSSLVGDLLDISKIRAGKFEIVEDIFDVDSMVKEIVENYQLLSPTHTITLDGSTHAKVKGDRDKVGQVLINLIVNAIKYSPTADRITIKCATAADEVTISVRDYGIGIKKRHQTKIFERFFQVGNKVGQNFSGLGIGLYISSAIVSRHRGRMAVESSSKGSVFSFTLPMHVKTSAPKKIAGQ